MNGLAVHGLSVRYGGHVAVRDVSFHVPRAATTGLIGPNGAGKTSVINACAGTVRPLTGAVTLDGRDLTGLSVASRGRAGLGRTFQRTAVFESLTVRENVALGWEAAQAGAIPWRHLAAGARDRRFLRVHVDEALAVVGAQHLAETKAARLSASQRRVVELARAVAGGFEVLMLDEPSAGLDAQERDAFIRTVDRLVDERGTGILLVEHDMELVIGMCAQVVVLDTGALVFEGTTRAMVADRRVRRAYLGQE